MEDEISNSNEESLVVETQYSENGQRMLSRIKMSLPTPSGAGFVQTFSLVFHIAQYC
jgi:hypothetical protein